MLKRLTIWLGEETIEKLKTIAKEQDRSVGWLLRKAAEEYVVKSPAERKG